VQFVKRTVREQLPADLDCEREVLVLFSPADGLVSHELVQLCTGEEALAELDLQLSRLVVGGG
jgi:hypothetical protein